MPVNQGRVFVADALVGYDCRPGKKKLSYIPAGLYWIVEHIRLLVQPRLCSRLLGSHVVQAIIKSTIVQVQFSRIISEKLRNKGTGGKEYSKANEASPNPRRALPIGAKIVIEPVTIIGPKNSSPCWNARNTP